MLRMTDEKQQRRRHQYDTRREPEGSPREIKEYRRCSKERMRNCTAGRRRKRSANIQNTSELPLPSAVLVPETDHPPSILLIPTVLLSLNPSSIRYAFSLPNQRHSRSNHIQQPQLQFFNKILRINLLSHFHVHVIHIKPSLMMHVPCRIKYHHECSLSVRMLKLYIKHHSFPYLIISPLRHALK